MRPVVRHFTALPDRAEVRERVLRLAEPGHGPGGTVLLTGEAGIGKSTLWAEGVRAARSSGIRVLSAGAAEAESSMPHVVLGDLLADVIDEVDADLPAPQREALEVALLRASPGRRPPSPRLLAMAVHGVLARCAEHSTVLVAIDDLQWADEASQDALAFALRRLSGVRLLFALRTGGPFDPTSAVPEPVSALLDVIDHNQRLVLPPLTPGEIRELIRDRTTLSVSKTEVQQICAATLGNPFWALELASAWLRDDHRPNDPLPVPEALQSMTAARLITLPEEVVDALCVVSALGSPSFRLAVLALEAMTDDPIGALDRATEEGVVFNVDGRLSAAHPLLSTAALTMLPPGRQLELHSRIVEVAETPDVRAHHLAKMIDEAAPADMRARVALAFDEAVEHARGRGATTHAVRLAEQALEFTGCGDEALERRRIVAAQLHNECSNFVRADELLKSIDLTALDTALLEVALPLIAGLTYLLSGPDAAFAELTRAHRPGEQDNRRLAALHLHYADKFYGDLTRREQHARIAAEYAARTDNPGPVTYKALLHRIEARVDAGKGLDTFLLAQARAMEPAGGPAPTRLAVLLARCQVTLDDPAGSRRTLTAALEAARTVADDVAISMLSMNIGEAELWEGDVNAARRSLRDSDEAMDWVVFEPTHRAQLRARLWLAVGETESVERLVADLGWAGGEHRTRRMAADHMLGLAAAQRGDVSRAVELLTRARDEAESMGLRDPGSRYRIDTELAEMLVHAQRPAEAAVIANRLAALGREHDRCSLRGTAHRINGLVAMAEGDPVLAEGEMSLAIAEHEKSQLAMELGRSLLARARVRLARGARRLARPDLDRALELFAGGGFTVWAGRVESELARISSSGSAEVLTAAERRVVDVVAAGMTNKEAALSLHVGTRTVESHLAAAYRKLGVNSRRELARLYHQQNRN